ncbi:MAG: tetratricopeptide repeat protein [Acidobacteria bacterium]|nr:tetratricopeptide repeat protein [Acidobacteriota bacterium]
MRTHLIRGSLALAVLFVMAGPAAAQSVIRGRVVDQGGKPVDGAVVTIEATESNRRAQVKTNRNGEFMQIGLPSGRYNVTATKDNLKAVQQATITQGNPTELNFQLSPTSGLTPEQIKQNQETQTLAEQAIAAMRAGRDEEAIKLFNDLVVKVPTCSDCYYNLGVAYSKRQQFNEAEASFRKATELAPNSADAYTGLANLYNAQKKFDLAQQASAKAAELAGAVGGGGSAEALYNQGVILWNAGKFAEAKEQFEKAVQADPKLAMAYYQLGMANLNLGQVPAAREAFEGYLKADPNGPKAAEVQGFLKQLPQ